MVLIVDRLHIQAVITQLLRCALCPQLHSVTPIHRTLYFLGINPRCVARDWKSRAKGKIRFAEVGRNDTPTKVNSEKPKRGEQVRIEKRIDYDTNSRSVEFDSVPGHTKRMTYFDAIIKGSNGSVLLVQSDSEN
jgi:hypothetical protein